MKHVYVIMLDSLNKYGFVVNSQTKANAETLSILPTLITFIHKGHSVGVNREIWYLFWIFEN